MLLVDFSFYLKRESNDFGIYPYVLDTLVIFWYLRRYLQYNYANL